jgi:hypothetical protein
MSDVRCKSCRFFTQAQVMGLCRRFPETQNKHEMDWCGEHQLSVVTSVPVYDVMAQAEPKKRGRKPNAKTVA